MMFSFAETEILKDVLENYKAQLEIAMDNTEDKDILDICKEQLYKVDKLLTGMSKR